MDRLARPAAAALWALVAMCACCSMSGCGRDLFVDSDRTFRARLHYFDDDSAVDADTKRKQANEAGMSYLGGMNP